MAALRNKIRADKWLWYARFFKTRTLASQLCKSGKLRVNGERVSKASVTIQVGDVLTFPKVNDIKVVELLALGERRGPATEAQDLYEDQSLSAPSKAEVQEKALKEGSGVHRETGAGRPTKAERRATDKLMGRD